MIIGKKYHRLTVISKSHQNKEKRWFYKCICDCGNVVTAPKNGLDSGSNKSCGCIRGEKLKTHGMRNTREYGIWVGIKQRCLNTNSKDMKNYSGRGIGICKEWEESFVSFIKDMGMSPTSKHQIERLDNNKGYSKDNCTWATVGQNAKNRRTSRLWFIRGVFFECAKDAGIFWGVSEVTIHRWCKGGNRTKIKKDCFTMMRYADDNI